MSVPALSDAHNKFSGLRTARHPAFCEVQVVKPLSAHRVTFSALHCEVIDKFTASLALSAVYQSAI